MERSILTADYAAFLDQLRRARKSAGLTQEQVAERLHQTQSWVSKIERGERRLDVVEFRAYCRAINMSPCDFLRRLEDTLGA